MSTNLLFIDTALNGVSLGVHASGQSESFSTYYETVRGQAERIVPMINDVLAEANLSYQDLSGIVSTLGPGSFTGLRIGLSVAKSLALALDIEVKGISTFKALAQTAHAFYHEKEYKYYAILIETKRSDYYMQVFDNALNPCAAATSCELPKLIETLEAYEKCLVVGDAVDRLQKTLQAQAGADLVNDPDFQELKGVNPKQLAAFCADQWSQLESHVEPYYLRPADVSMPKQAPRKVAK